MVSDTTNFLIWIPIHYHLSFKLLKGKNFLAVDYCLTILPVKIMKAQ